MPMPMPQPLLTALLLPVLEAWMLGTRTIRVPQQELRTALEMLWSWKQESGTTRAQLLQQLRQLQTKLVPGVWTSVVPTTKAPPRTVREMSRGWKPENLII